LSVGSNTDGIDVRSVGNSSVLQETCLVEAFNLKAAIEFQEGNLDAAKEALSDMPPRQEEELDAVTLHNQALLHMDEDPSTGFRKLNFLLSNLLSRPRRSEICCFCTVSLDITTWPLTFLLRIPTSPINSYPVSSLTIWMHQ